MSSKAVSGLVLASATPPGMLPELARLGEQLGFDELWLPEDYFANGGIATTTAVLAATERVGVSMGIVSAVVRHPAVLAMEAASIEAMFPGRLRLGVGAGVPAWTDQMRLTPRSTLGAMRECIGAVRELMEGATVDRSGDNFAFRQVALARPAGPIPIVVGAIGPKMLQLSGEIADSTVLSVLASAPYVAWARQRITEGMARAGRQDEDHSVAAFVFCVIDDDEERARAATRPLLAQMLPMMPRSALFSVPGISDSIDELMNRAGPEGFADGIPDEWIDLLAVVGTIDTCRQRVEALRAAGADQVALASLGPSLPDAIEAAAALIG